MLCPKCGNALNEGSPKCHSCGFNLREDDTRTQYRSFPAEDSTPTIMDRPRKEPGKGPMIIVAVVAVVVFLILISILAAFVIFRTTEEEAGPTVYPIQMEEKGFSGGFFIFEVTYVSAEYYINQTSITILSKSNDGVTGSLSGQDPVNISGYPCYSTTVSDSELRVQDTNSSGIYDKGDLVMINSRLIGKGDIVKINFNGHTASREKVSKV